MNELRIKKRRKIRKRLIIRKDQMVQRREPWETDCVVVAEGRIVVEVMSGSVDTEGLEDTIIRL